MAFPFSDARRIGNTLYVSGQIGINESLIPPKELEDEVHLLMQNLKGVLEKYEATMEQVVMITIFAPDVANFEAFNAVYVTYFKGPLPARAFIGSGPLLFGGRFELTAIADLSDVLP